MFADLSPDSVWSNRSHRGWTTLVSFSLQALAVGCLLVLPLLYTEGLPKLAMLAPLLVPAPAPVAPPARSRPNPPQPAQSNLMGSRLLMPAQIPRNISVLTETVPPPPIDPTTFGVSRGNNQGNGTVFGSISGSDMYMVPPSVPSLAVHHPPISHMMEGNLIHRVQPDYPPLARQVRVQGAVVLQAIISREGTIEKLKVLSGHPMLIPAAVNAVLQWRYRPYVLNGEPVEVETQVTVNFVLSGG